MVAPKIERKSHWKHPIRKIIKQIITENKNKASCSMLASHPSILKLDMMKEKDLQQRKKTINYHLSRLRRNGLIKITDKKELETADNKQREIEFEIFYGLSE